MSHRTPPQSINQFSFNQCVAVVEAVVEYIAERYAPVSICPFEESAGFPFCEQVYVFGYF